MTTPPAKSEKPVKRVMISSTARDLPTHRDQVKEACLRQGMLPVMMEHLPATSDDAIKTSLKMVDEADIYLGIFAYRYGYIPEGHKLSITEMEYNQAVKRKIPCLIFIMHDDHPIKGSEIEKGAGAIKIEALKERMKKAQVINFFKSPEELAILVINSLSKYRESDLTAFHYISEIPTPPEAYIAHPYVLLQTPTLLGRQDELNLLTDWVTRPGTDLYRARILSVVAIGGMGKSALTWKWFNDIAPYEMNPLAGRMWWSFYESDASFDNFVIRALAYVSKRSREDIQQLSPTEREDQLLAVLDREPFLLALDGLERIMVAYARMDAARLADDDLDRETANVIADRLGLPESAAQSFIGQYRLRKTADPRVGNFLRKLANVRATRILVSTRLYPADLQTVTGNERFGNKGFFLHGLADNDALNMWRAFGVSGSRETLLPLFHTFENHPLLIQALAGVVAQDRRFPGDFDQWSKAHPSFSPFKLPLVQAKSHILEFALRGLDGVSRQVLHTLAAFRMPVGYGTLVDLFVGDDKSFQIENALIAVLADLEDRGLVGWDRRANRYDLHPIVRGVTWSNLGEQARHDVYEKLNKHFEALSILEEEREINSIDDLAPIIELYSALVGLGRYDHAFKLYRERLSNVMSYDLSALSQLKELLEMLFPDGLDHLPRLISPRSQSYVLTSLGFSSRDQLKRAINLERRSADIDMKNNDLLGVTISFANLSDNLRLSGCLYESEAAARYALCFFNGLLDNKWQELICLYWLGAILLIRGIKSDSIKTLYRSIKISIQGFLHQSHTSYYYLVLYLFYYGQYNEARTLIVRSGILSVKHHETVSISAIRVKGSIDLELCNWLSSEEHFHQALVRSRKANYVQEELASLIGLAELRRRQGDLKSAREYLDDTWEAAERGPFRLLQADAFNTLAQIERDAGNHSAAVEAAKTAYRHSWCDGPPYAYHWGLEAAKAHLSALNAPEPIMPPFDPSKYEPMPDVEIDPDDEYHVGDQTLEDLLREIDAAEE
jgi:tetratricopeptide (TPR) repeat protein